MVELQYERTRLARGLDRDVEVLRSPEDEAELGDVVDGLILADLRETQSGVLRIRSPRVPLSTALTVAASRVPRRTAMFSSARSFARTMP